MDLFFDYGIKHHEGFHDVKLGMHHYLIEQIEADELSLAEIERDVLDAYLREKVVKYVAENRLAVTADDIEQMAQDMLNELTGYGPIEALMKDELVSDIMINGACNIFVERAGRLQRCDLRFIDDAHVLRVIRRIVSPLGRRVDESSPMVDARMPDGSRVNAIIPPIALDGPCLSIRKFRKDPLTAGDLLAFGTINDAMFEFLKRAVENRMNILISGGTGSGKTTLLNVLSRFIPTDQRLVTIEDAAELQLGHSHVIRLETRPSNVDGNGEIVARDLVRNALRMRPDRIIVGEIRGTEVMDVLQAMNTGHDGCMSTIHANNPRDALLRVEMLIGMTGYEGKESTLKAMVASGLDLIVQVSRTANGSRKVISIVEMQGVRDNHFVTSELFSYDPERGGFAASGIAPASLKFQRSPF
jgi:pilus assembly protein CpaF